MTDSAERHTRVGDAVGDVRGIVADGGVTQASLDAVKARLIALAGFADLFPRADFPTPPAGAESPTALYRLSEDADHGFALYLQACNPGFDVPPHNHTTWAVIAGIDGVEENRFYDRAPDDRTAPPRETGRLDVVRGEGVAFLPEALHSIHIHGEVPVYNFHMYGRALDHLHARDYWSHKAQAWKIFPAHVDIIDRSAG